LGLDVVHHVPDAGVVLQAVVACPHRRGQSVLHAVRPAGRLGLVGEALHGDHRAEPLPVPTRAARVLMSPRTFARHIIDFFAAALYIDRPELFVDHRTRAYLAGVELFTD
jgi:hypothetical protein